MTHKLFDASMYLLDSATRRYEQATEMYKRNEWFDGYFVGLWGRALYLSGVAVGEVAKWLDKEAGQ